MEQNYIVFRDGCYKIAGTRVSLDSLVYPFLEGLSAESIARSFPALTLEQVYGAITYYLAHREEVDAHLKAEEADFEQQRQDSRVAHPDLYAQIQAARARREASRR